MQRIKLCIKPNVTNFLSSILLSLGHSREHKVLRVIPCVIDEYKCKILCKGGRPASLFKQTNLLKQKKLINSFKKKKLIYQPTGMIKNTIFG